MTSEILIFSRTTGYRHDSIPDGVEAITALGKRLGLTIIATEDSAVFTPGELGRFAAIVFCSTSGQVFDDDQRESFERYMRSGGGYVGIHAASTTEYDWPFYADVAGAYFSDHPKVQPATVHVMDHDHPATAHLSDTWDRTDEWYNFTTDPSERVNVLLTVNEASYEGGTMGPGHPLAWYHENTGGRSFYTALGHTSESFRNDDDFLTHVAGGIRYAARLP